MRRKDIFPPRPIILTGKRRSAESSWPEEKRNPSSIGRHLDQCGDLRGRNSRLKTTDERLFNVNIGREDIGFWA
jgi:hypothetical protein